MPNRPPWLKELNNSKPTPGTEPAESVEAGEDEHVEPLFQYEAPPPLVLGTPPVAATQPDTVTESNSTQLNATALPFTFNAADFEDAIKSPNGKAFDMEQEWPAFGFSKPTVPPDVPPGIYTATIDEHMQVKPIGPIAVPANWNQPAEPVVNDPVPVTAPWLAGMGTANVIAFDNHIKAVLAVNPAHAAILLRLKGWQSPYVGHLDTVEKAEHHIAICYDKQVDIGGWQDKGQAAIKKAETLLNEELARQELLTLRHKHREFVEAARKEWKAAIEYRRQQTDLLNLEVANKHEAFKVAKELTFEEWRVLDSAN